MKHTIDGVRSYLALRAKTIIVSIPQRDDALLTGVALVHAAAHARQSEPAIARVHLTRAIDYWETLAAGQYHEDAKRLGRLIDAAWGAE